MWNESLEQGDLQSYFQTYFRAFKAYRSPYLKPYKAYRTPNRTPYLKPYKAYRTPNRTPYRTDNQANLSSDLHVYGDVLRCSRPLSVLKRQSGRCYFLWLCLHELEGENQATNRKHRRGSYWPRLLQH
jgi:hypothetical protein